MTTEQQPVDPYAILAATRVSYVVIGAFALVILHRAATREPIGKGLRPSVASTRDLARMLAALDRAEDAHSLCGGAAGGR